MRLLVGCLLALAACGGDGGSPNGDDGNNVTDAAGSLDGSPSSDSGAPSGLTVLWNDQPMIPGPFGTGVQINSVRLKIDSLEVVGDAGGTDTTRLTYDAPWMIGGIEPFPISFPNAQPGLYSQISIRIESKTALPSYEILGTVVTGAGPEPFKITDNAQLDVTVSNYNLQYFGGSVDLFIRVNMQAVINAASPATLPLVQGTRTLDQNDTTMRIDAVRSAMESAVFIKGP